MKLRTQDGGHAVEQEDTRGCPAGEGYQCYEQQKKGTFRLSSQKIVMSLKIYCSSPPNNR